jgi:hypothetical protein
MVIRQSAMAALAALVLGSFLTAPVFGKSALHTTKLTFSGPVALPGVTLPTGTYVFEQLDFASPDVVVVRSGDRSKVHFLGLTQRVHRPPSMRPDRMVTFGEARRGAPTPITAWYPPDAGRGYQFLYPR